MEEVTVNGKRYGIKRTTSFGAYASAKLNGNLITISVPFYLGKGSGSRIFLNLRDKMLKRLEKSVEQESKPEYLKFYDGQTLSVMGKSFAIAVRQAGPRSRARLKGETITITLADGLNDSELEKHTYSLCRKLITKKVLPDIVTHVNELNTKHFGFRVEQIRLKDQLTRWGSYSRKTNRINLNFRLLFAPPDVLDSVIIHELAHIKHQNHSKRFWKLVLGAMPDYKEKRKWLRKNGSTLGIFTKPEPIVQTRTTPEPPAQEKPQPIQMPNMVVAQDPKQSE